MADHKNRTCVTCGEKFNVPYTKARQKTCSEECHRIARRERARELGNMSSRKTWYERQAQKTFFNCLVCGEPRYIRINRNWPSRKFFVCDSDSCQDYWRKYFAPYCNGQTRRLLVECMLEGKITIARALFASMALENEAKKVKYLRRPCLWCGQLITERGDILVNGRYACLHKGKLTKQKKVPNDKKFCCKQHAVYYSQVMTGLRKSREGITREILLNRQK